MKKIVTITTVLSIIVPSLMVVTFLYNDYKSRNDTTQSLSLEPLKNISPASFSFTKPSAVSQNFSLVPSLAVKPLPTNKWWTNAAVASPWPEPLFNIPLSTTLNENGVTIGLPAITSTADSIQGAASTDITLSPNGTTTRTQVRSYDDVSLNIDAINQNNAVVYSTRLVKGLPFVYCSFNSPFTIDTSNATEVNIKHLGDARDVLSLSVGPNKYAVYAPSNADMVKDGNIVSIQASENIVVASLPIEASNDTQKEFDSASANLVTGATVTHETSESTTTTRIKYLTENNNDTIIGSLPHQRNNPKSKLLESIGKLKTIRGDMELAKGSTLVYETTIPANNLILKLPEDNETFSKAQLEAYLVDDLHNTVSPNSYDGGKELFRLANLTMISHESTSQTINEYDKKLRDELVNWLTYSPGEDNRYFYYDKKIKGLVAVEPQYGSEKFSDHHFHYGYFLYAAAVLATYDKSFLEDYGAAVSFIGEDIASEGSNLFPRHRTYDAYDGHSWASGVDAFRDGNNQESISEAVHAWYSLYNWAKISGNKPQESTAGWLFANEAAAATTYYYESQLNPYPEAYQHSIVSLVWGGKSDYATWFSDLPEAKHAILMLPISGGSSYLKANGAMSNSVAELNNTLQGAPRRAYQDILLLGESLLGSSRAQGDLKNITQIDNSNSRSYLYYFPAWEASQL